MKNTLPSFWLIVSLAFIAGVDAKQPTALPATNAQTSIAKIYQLNSKLMMRQMSYRVILPANYATVKTERFPVVYMLHGIGGSYRSLSTNLAAGAKSDEYYANYPFIIVLPEGGAGFYTDSATNS